MIEAFTQIEPWGDVRADMRARAMFGGLLSSQPHASQESFDALDYLPNQQEAETISVASSRANVRLALGGGR